MSTAFKYPGELKSHQSLNEVYFRTSIIKDWKQLLKNDKMKMIIIESFQWLAKHELVYLWLCNNAESHTCFMGTIKNEWGRKLLKKASKNSRAICSYSFQAGVLTGHSGINIILEYHVNCF